MNTITIHAARDRALKRSYAEMTQTTSPEPAYVRKTNSAIEEMLVVEVLASPTIRILPGLATVAALPW